LLFVPSSSFSATQGEVVGLTRTRDKAYWESKNLILAPGEVGFEFDTGKSKRGNGTARWNDLPYTSYPAFYVPPEVVPAAPSAAETVAESHDTDVEREAFVPARLSAQSLLATFASAAITAQARWNARKRANYERDNAAGFTIFIDSVKGNDANTGASPAQAWKTLGKLTTAGVAAGARIGLARGSTFSGNFTVPTVTGTLSATNRVTIGAYGYGAAPIITGGQLTIGQPYIDVQDLWFTNAGSSYALFIFNATAGVVIGNQVKRCEFGPHTGTGGLIAGIIGGLVEDCYFHDVWSNAEYPSGNGAGCFFTTGTDSTVVRFNVVRNCYKGIMAGNTHRSLLIHHNIVDKCRVNGIDMSGGGTVGFPPIIVNNFVWHRPSTPNGHGIDTQSSTTGHRSRNNIVYCDYNGATGNVELYCIDSLTYSDGDYDYNLGWIKPGTSGAAYGKLGTITYATLAAYQTAMASTAYLGKEAHSISADPLLADLAGGLFIPMIGSPAINAGVVLAGISDLFLGTAPDLGAYEVA
jgi:hypothetical protein